jgi:hypothetical protein
MSVPLCNLLWIAFDNTLVPILHNLLSLRNLLRLVACDLASPSKAARRGSRTLTRSTTRALQTVAGTDVF